MNLLLNKNEVILRPGSHNGVLRYDEQFAPHNTVILSLSKDLCLFPLGVASTVLSNTDPTSGWD